MIDLSFRFDGWFERLPKSPADLGRVERCVVRTGRGQRATPDVLELVEGRGVLGDSWSWHPHSHPGNQVALVNVHVARAVADGDPQRMALLGDNLQVDLELGEDNLPVGTRLRIGSAVLRVSAEVHRPCRSFVERFGALNAKRVARATRIGKRGRGVLCEVVVGGSIRVGDEIRIERPAAGD